MQLSKLENILISLQYMRQWWRYVDYILYFLHKYRQLYADVIMQVSAYLLGEYSHLLARRPGCSPKDIFVIIHEKLPTVSWVFLFLYIYVFFCDHHLFFFVSTGLQQYPFFSQHTQRFWCTLNHQIPNYKTRSGQYSASEFIINRSYTFFLYMQNLIIFNFTHIDRYETCIDTEIQQRAVQLFIFNSTLAKILNF